MVRERPLVAEPEDVILNADLLYSGFMVEVKQRKCHWVDGGWQDVIIMGILREDWMISRET